jgi:hypothetical protein
MARHQDDFLRRLVAGLSFRSILLHPATWFVIASVATLGGAIQLWNSCQADIVDQEKYRLTADKIHLAAPPEWSDADLKQLVLKTESPDANPSLLDTALVSRTVNAFRNVGWVEKVQTVEKSKKGLNIELVYRNAVGVVELNHLTIANWPPNQTPRILPVDRTGMVMPGEIAADRELLRFSIFNPARNTGLDPWTPWPDERVKSAAAISEAIGTRWQDFGLYRIVTFRKPDQPNDQTVPFELWPDVGTQVIWGNPPGQEVSSEASAAEKIQAIEEFVAHFGQLNRLPKQRIDVRSGKAIVVGDVKTAKLESLSLGHK